jgi:hypothetical protein
MRKKPTAKLSSKEATDPLFGLPDAPPAFLEPMQAKLVDAERGQSIRLGMWSLGRWSNRRPVVRHVGKSAPPWPSHNGESVSGTMVKAILS